MKTLLEQITEYYNLRPEDVEELAQWDVENGVAVRVNIWGGFFTIEVREDGKIVTVD